MFYSLVVHLRFQRDKKKEFDAFFVYLRIILGRPMGRKVLAKPSLVAVFRTQAS